MTSGVASLTLDMRIEVSRGAVKGWSVTEPVHGQIRKRGKKLMHSDPNLPQTPRAFRKDRGLSRPRPGRTAANSDSPWTGPLTRLSATATGGADARSAFNRGAGPDSAREFPQFEHGAWI